MTETSSWKAVTAADAAVGMEWNPDGEDRQYVTAVILEQHCETGEYRARRVREIVEEGETDD